MLKMVLILAPIFFLFFLCSNGQEPLQISTFHHQDSAPGPLKPISHTLGVAVDQEKVIEVSTSILMAEKWLKTHVLSYYPSTNITSIVVANNLICNSEDFKGQDEKSKLTLVSMENIHHSLVRWGLERKIKVSVSISPNCLHQSPVLKPVFGFLEEINSTYTVRSPDFSDEMVKILTFKDSGVFGSKMVNVIVPLSKQTKPTSRKLSFIDPFPVESPEELPTSEVGYSVPSDAAMSALPPLVGVSSPSPFTLPLSPEIQPPLTAPPPHYGFNLPPCNPHPNPHHGGGGGSMAAPPGAGRGAMAAAPVAGGGEGLWCVAKPSVPSEKLQEAMDYACGAGGADCGAISPRGSCYFPDSPVAHASYAFNSYWQKNKKNGGTCGFGGTAMLINSDPSFLQCHFILG